MKRIKRQNGWISGHETPMRVGVYERLEPGGDDDDVWYRFFSFWDGKEWGWTQEYASGGDLKVKAKRAELFRYPVSQHQDWPWRGVVK